MPMVCLFITNMNRSMNTIFRTLTAITLLALPLTAGAAELSSGDKEFVEGYVKVGAALAGDNLENAKQAAAEMGEFGAALAKSENIAAARQEFERLSARAISLAHGQEGYYTVNCPMLRKDWLQPAGRISNPYAGATMPDCGKIRKAPVAAREQ